MKNKVELGLFLKELQSLKRDLENTKSEDLKREILMDIDILSKVCSQNVREKEEA